VSHAALRHSAEDAMTLFEALAMGGAVLLAADSPAADKDSAVPALPAWMAGAWAMQGPSEWSEEYWTPPRAGIMLGASRSGSGERLRFWELMRIERRAEGLVFCALPRGQQGACFKAVAVTANEIVFENRAHDFPQRILYRKDGDELFAEISGPKGAQLQSWRFRRLK
jgi:hypothetical protein